MFLIEIIVELLMSLFNIKLIKTPISPDFANWKSSAEFKLVMKAKPNYCPLFQKFGANLSRNCPPGGIALNHIVDSVKSPNSVEIKPQK